MRRKIEVRTFERKDYKGSFNILASEKRLMLKALKQTDGNLKLAWELMCPSDQKYCSYHYFCAQIIKHNIDLDTIIEAKAIRTRKIQEKLKKLAQTRNIKLRSIQQ